MCLQVVLDRTSAWYLHGMCDNSTKTLREHNARCVAEEKRSREFHPWCGFDDAGVECGMKRRKQFFEVWHMFSHVASGPRLEDLELFPTVDLQRVGMVESSVIYIGYI